MTHLADLTTNSQRYYIVSYIVTSFLMWFICVVNVGLSIASAFSQNISRSLTASGIRVSDNFEALSEFSHLCDGVTILVCCIAVYADFCSRRFLLKLPLCLWDMARFLFIMTCIFSGPTDPSISQGDQGDQGDRFRLHLYAVLLLICILIELYCLNLSSIEDDNIVFRNPRSTPPSPPSYSSLVDVEPPSYSSLKLSAASPPGQPKPTSLANVPGRSVGATFTFVDLPPPYEYEICSGNPISFPRNREELEQPINP